jgi:hypothetical protein
MGDAMTTAEARRMAQVSLQLDQERIARRQLEHKLAGTRSALVKLQAEVAKQKAEVSASKAEQHVR